MSPRSASNQQPFDYGKIISAILKNMKNGAPERIEFFGSNGSIDGTGWSPVQSPLVQSGIVALVELLLNYDIVIDGQPITAIVNIATRLAAMSKKLDRVIEKLEQIEARLVQVQEQLGEIAQKVGQIGAIVAEQRLREDINYLFEKHFKQNQFIINDFCDDLLNSLNTFEYIFKDNKLKIGSVPGLIFAVETRDLLNRTFRLLRGVRMAAFAATTNDAEGDPALALTSDPVEDYWPQDMANPYVFALRFNLFGHLNSTRKETVIKLRPHPFIWAKDFDDWAKKKIMKPTEDIIAKVDGDAVRLEKELRTVVPDAASSDPYVFIMAYRTWWLYKTDAGLVWRVRKEAEGLIDHYKPFLKGRKLSTLDILITVPLENASES